MLIRQINKSHDKKGVISNMKQVKRLRIINEVKRDISALEEYNDKLTQEQGVIENQQNYINKDIAKHSDSKTFCIGHSCITTFTNDELTEHIQTCLEMSSENKITPKNAFALQLIDCMNFLLNKKDFSTMACTLDAGAKIYSYRVDALHQQVLKLADGVIQHQTDASGRGKEENNTKDEDVSKRKKKDNKKNVIASSESLRKHLKAKDPKNKFMKVGGLPGAILTVCERNPHDLSITLENNIQFWNDFDQMLPLKGEGSITLPECKIFRNGNTEVKRSNMYKAIENEGLSIRDLEVATYPSPIKSLILESDECGESHDHSESNSEVEVISTAMKKLNEEAEQKGTVEKHPSRLEVMKLIFEKSSDYHYLDMKNSHFWAGPEFWKRSKVNKATGKKLRKKVEPREIIYNFAVSEKNKKFTKKCTILTKRTISGWKRKKLTLPRDLKYDENLFLDLFSISINSNNILQNSLEMANDLESLNTAITPQEISHPMESQNSLETSFYDGVYEDQMDASEDMEEKDNLNSAFYDEGLVQRSGAFIDKSIKKETGKAIKVEIGLTGSTSLGESLLVPAPKIVRVEPIKYSSRPIRIDMQHLKKIMLDVIKKDIEEDANDKRIWGDCSGPETNFRTILSKLPARLERKTAEDLSPAMALMALLTLANENNLHLENNAADDVIVRFESPTSSP